MSAFLISLCPPILSLDSGEYTNILKIRHDEFIIKVLEQCLAYNQVPVNRDVSSCF